MPDWFLQLDVIANRAELPPRARIFYLRKLVSMHRLIDAAPDRNTMNGQSFRTQIAGDFFAGHRPLVGSNHSALSCSTWNAKICRPLFATSQWLRHNMEVKIDANLTSI